LVTAAALVTARQLQRHRCRQRWMKPLQNPTPHPLM
jgi:hypothetical protein